ncbi:hypothetical protein PQX77_006633 [Marasmius sp. AFHP31]|nr:hypothetical protein PQX77_006633 [Marasmius sp. AFHP31]
MGDIIVTRNVSSKVLEATIEPRRRTSKTGTSQQSESKVIKVRMTTQHVKVLNLPGKFTSIAVEEMEEDQAEDFKTIVNRLGQELSCQRSPLHPQLVGLGWSEQPIFIVYDELTNGDEYTDQIWAEKKWIVYFYLLYTHSTSFQALHSNNTLTIPVSIEWNLWMFNHRTHTWQYDVSSVAILPPNNDASLLPIVHPITPLRQDTHPQLDADEIVTCFEDQLGDFLHVIASFGEIRHMKDLSDFAQHGLLTFGAVVDCNKPGILAHFPSTPPLKWYSQSFSAGVKASYSTSGMFIHPLHSTLCLLVQSPHVWISPSKIPTVIK